MMVLSGEAAYLINPEVAAATVGVGLGSIEDWFGRIEGHEIPGLVRERCPPDHGIAIPVECHQIRRVAAECTVDQEQARKPRAEGHAQFRLPQHPFTVVIDAAGYALGRVGPIDPEGAEALIRVTLDEVPTVRGRVFTDEGPLSGAKVRDMKSMK